MTDDGSRDDGTPASEGLEQATQAASAAADVASGAQQMAENPAAGAAGVASGAAGAAAAAGAPQAQQAQQAMSAAGQAASSAQQMQHDPVGGLLGLVGGAAGVAGAAAGANEAAAQAASTVSQVSSAASTAASAVSALSSSSSTAATPSTASSSAAAEPAQAYGNIGPSADSPAWPTANESRDDVTLTVEIDGLEDVLLGLRSADFHEALNEVPRATIEVRCEGELPEARSLLGANCAIRVERSVQVRSFRGIVHHVQIEETVDGPILRAEIAPALWLLQWITDTRVYQNKTVLEVVQELFDEKLGGRERQIRNECERTYEAHEYLVQYGESYLAFMNRLLESEGIFYYFDHEEDREVLVLADKVDGRPTVREEEGGEVPFWEDADQAPDQEAITEIHHIDSVGPTDVVVAGYDWTNPRLSVKTEHTGRGEGQPALERYEPHQSVTYHQYDGEKFGANTASMQAELHRGLLDLARQHWQMHGTVVTAQPGRVMEVSGNPAGHDGRYFIVSVRTHLVATEGTTGSIAQSLDCTPAELPYHPPRRTRTPVVQGLESAVVVGEDGDEIHTDPHRRIRVQFHWDRLGERNQHSSCFIRVAQMWAGEGWGTLFLPRVGMEVIVSFLGGHPHRPVVIGSLYNGVNTPPYTSDEDITKSTIKTSSSPGGDGYNELRFEDAAGSEEIFIHAQKDMNEVIENNHSTSVGGNQTNSVSGNRTHSVDKNETITVTGSQKITISGSETGDGQEIQGAQLDITGKYKLDASDEMMVQAPNKITLTVGGSSVTIEPGKITLAAGDGSTLVLDANAFAVSSQGTQMLLDANACIQSSGSSQVLLDANAAMQSSGGSRVVLDANASMAANGGGQVLLDANAVMSGGEATMRGDSQATVTAATSTLAGAAGSVEAAAAGVTASGPKVDVSGTGAVNITGAVVKIN